jgi:hypothetical protein
MNTHFTRQWLKPSYKSLIINENPPASCQTAFVDIAMCFLFFILREMSNNAALRRHQQLFLLAESMATSRAILSVRKLFLITYSDFSSRHLLHVINFSNSWFPKLQDLTRIPSQFSPIEASAWPL